MYHVKISNMQNNPKNYKIKIRELILTNKKNAGCETFVYEPSSIEEESLGNLYVLGYIKDGKKDLDFLPNLIASLARREFYKLTDTDPDIGFEAALKKINAAVLDIAKEYKNLKKHISFCIINTNDDNIRFSQIGNHIIYLVRNGSLSNINKEGCNTLFSSIVTGVLQSQDRYIFATEKIKDLFTRQDAEQVLRYKIDKQAEIISDAYENMAKENALQAQAAILLEIGEEAKARPFGSLFETNSDDSETASAPQENMDAPENKKDSWQRNVYNFLNRKKIFITSVFLVISILYASSIYAKVSEANKILNQVNSKISEAENKTNTEREEALSILNSSKGLASTLYSYPFFTKQAKILENHITNKINEVNGVFNIADAQNIADITGKSIGFKPKFIFEHENNAYVFGDRIDIFYKIRSGLSFGSFIFLDAIDFGLERAYSKDGLFYFINYIGEQAYYFDPTTEKPKKIEKNLNQMMQIKPTPYEKDFRDYHYTLDKNRMAKSPIQDNDEIEKYFNFFNMARVKDFAVSGDEKYIYLLTETQVYKTENK